MERAEVAAYLKRYKWLDLLSNTVTDNALNYIGLLRKWASVLCCEGYFQAEIEAERERCKTERRKLESLKNEIETVIDDLEDDNQRAIMRKLYLDGMTKEQVAEAVYLDPVTVYRWERKALEQIGKQKREIV